MFATIPYVNGLTSLYSFSLLLIVEGKPAYPNVILPLICSIWKHTALFPILACIALDFLAIPAASVEQNLSKSRHICSELWGL